ncbi:MAG: benzoate/H(+) symporter BenE family transporter [Aeromonadaceae bacterium]
MPLYSSLQRSLRSLRPHHLSSGLIAVLVGYTSSAVIIFQAAASAGATAAQLGSWLTVLGLGMGMTTLGLSLYYRIPILTAWSTPGAALLISSLAGVPMAEAIGAFLCSSLLLLICGFSGLFARIMHRLPLHLANAMLAGILLRFGLDLFHAFQLQPLLVAVMGLSYLCLKPLIPRYTLALTLLFGMVVAWQLGLLHLESIEPAAVQLIWTTPEFSLHSLLGIALPLFLVTMSSQNLPGVAVLRAHDYQPPVSPLVGWTGLTGAVLAPFGCYALNLAAITAALCMTKEADPQPERRYLAACCAGFLYLLTGLLGATVASLFAALPQALIMAIAGLALLGTLGHSLHQALQPELDREAAIITFLVTASGVSGFGIGAAFWGLLAGTLALALRADRLKYWWRRAQRRT